MIIFACTNIRFMMIAKTAYMKCLLFSISCFLYLLIFGGCSPEPENVTGLAFKISDDSDWGIIGTDGKVSSMNTYKLQPTSVVGGRFWVPDEEGRWHLYDAAHPKQPLSNKEYIQAGYFFEETTIAQEAPGEPLLIIDKQGEVQARLDTYHLYTIVLAHNFSEGLALVCTDDLKYGYVDCHGEMVIKPVYDVAYDFSERVAIVGTADADGQLSLQTINRRGETVCYLPVQNSRVDGVYCAGKLGCKDRQWGHCSFLDKQGKTAFRLPDAVKEVLPYSHAVAVCFTDQGAGLINRSGKMVIPANYEYGKVVSAGRMAFLRRGKWGLFDLDGKPLSEFAYDEIGDFHGGNYTFVSYKGSYRLMDRQGSLVDNSLYAVVVEDEVAERKEPQIFLRAPIIDEAIVNLASEETQPAPEVAASRIEAIKKISTASPFYEESRKILSSNLPEEDMHNRQMILDYTEHFRTAYTTKDIDFLEQLFSEEALIVVGRVVKKVPRQEQNLLSAGQVVYNIRSKKEYLSRLKQVFAGNKEIDVYFDDFKIRRHPTQAGIYGVSMKQGYRSDLYSDEGYLFLLWDFRNKQAPLIHVRTWQPAMLNAETPLPAEEIFNLGSFNLE